MRITDKQGRVVGTLNTGTAEEAETAAVIGIPGASYSSRQAGATPPASDRPARRRRHEPDHPSRGADDYKIEIIDTAGKATSVAVHTYGKDGTPSISTIETDKPAVADVAIQADGSGAEVTVQKGVKPTPEPEVTAQNQEEATPDAGTPSATASASVPTPTPTPPPLETALQLPADAGQARIETASNEGFFIGDTIVLDPGTAIEESNTIIGFGSFILASPLRFSHSAGATIVRIRQAPPNPDGSPPEGAPTEQPPPLVAPDNVTIGCSTLYNSNPKRATVICGATIAGEFTSIRWTSNGTIISEAANKQSLFLSFDEDTSTTVVLTACNITICRSTSAVEAIRFPVVNTLSTTTGSATPGQPVPPPPPKTGIVVSCATGFDAISGVAQVNCIAVFPDGTPYTSITWSAPGATPPGQTSQSDTFTTTVADPNQTIRITATICNYSDCSTSDVYELSFGATVVELVTFPSGSGDYPQFQEITLTATVRGPTPPLGGQVIFRSGGTDLGPATLIPAGDFGFASLTVIPNNDPQQLIGIDLGARTLTAYYTGGATLFPGTSDPVDINIVMGVPDDCDSIDNDGDNQFDEDCIYTNNPKSVGGGTVVKDLSIKVGGGLTFTGPSAVAAPGDVLAVQSTVNRTDYCPGCIRQVYMAIAENPTANSPGIIDAQGPYCLLSNVLNSDVLVERGFTAPLYPGVYYIRLTGSLQYSCIAVDVGSPATTTGRIVVRSTTDTVLTSSATSNSYQSTTPVTFTATVHRLQGAGGTPVGSVAFSGITGMTCILPGTTTTVSNNVGVPLVNGARTISCNTSALTAGSISVGAVFTGQPTPGLSTGDPNATKFYSDSTATALAFDINYPAPQLTATANPFNPTSGTAGATSDIDPLRITGSNFFPDLLPDGVTTVTTVQFDPDGTGPLGATPLSLSSVTSTEIRAVVPQSLLANTGTATVIVTNPTPGGGTVTGSFPIANANTVTTLNNPGSHPLGSNVTFAGTVTESSAGNVIGDTVRLCRSGTGPNCTAGNLLGSDTLSAGGPGTGNYSIVVSGLAVGPHPAQAYYLGSSNFGPSTSGVQTATITAADSDTNLSLSLGPHPLGSSVTLTADVTSTEGGGANITGSVTFRLGGTSCSTGTALAAAVSLDSSDSAELMTSAIPAGVTQTLRACYSGTRTTPRRRTRQTSR